MRTTRARTPIYLIPTKPASLAQAKPPTAAECERGGCLEHCPKPGFDPLWAAVIGASVGGIIIGTAAFYVGKRKR